MVICLERGADLHMAQLMPLPLTVSCFSKIQISFTFLVPAHPGSTDKRPLKGYKCKFSKPIPLTNNDELPSQNTRLLDFSVFSSFTCRPICTPQTQLSIMHIIHPDI